MKAKAPLVTIVGWYRAGHSTHAIARRIGTQASNVARRLKRAGVAVSSHPLCGKRANVTTAHLATLYLAGQTAESVGSEFGMSKAAVLDRFRRHNVPRRTKREGYVSGAAHHLWKGGRLVDKQGYVLITIAGGKRRLEHRLVMERVLGRSLNRLEYVHHINGIRDDNRPENLVLTTPTKHESRTLITALQRRICYLESLLRDHSEKERGATSGTKPIA